MPITSSYSKAFFALAFVLVLYLFYQMLRPFLITVIFALTLVSLFHANYLDLDRRLGSRPNLTSAIMCFVVVTLIIIPLLLFFVALLNQLTIAYETFQIQFGNGSLGDESYWTQNAFLQERLRELGDYLGVEGLDLMVLVSSLLERMVQYLSDHYASILGGIGAFLFKFVVMVLSMFFFFRDGEALVKELKKLIPLAPEHEDLVLRKLKEVTHATFFGIFATGICQGIMAGVIFFFVGIENVILWGTAVAVFSLVPVVGTATVWLPMSLYLILSGSALKGIILLILGSTLIGLVDNLIRPLIIEVKAQGMHLLLVFFALVGGLLLFGPSGFVLGPLVAVLFVTFLEIYKIEFGDELAIDSADD